MSHRSLFISVTLLVLLFSFSARSQGREWTMTSAGSIGGLLTDLAQNAGYFAGSDFDCSVALANQFERPELRLMAQLKIAQGILASAGNSGLDLVPPLRGLEMSALWLRRSLMFIGGTMNLKSCAPAERDVSGPA